MLRKAKELLVEAGGTRADIHVFTPASAANGISHCLLMAVGYPARVTLSLVIAVASVVIALLTEYKNGIGAGRSDFFRHKGEVESGTFDASDRA